jgi:hypothetical protein
MTTDEARKYRIDAEATILAVLQRLSVVTGLDIADVKAICYVDAAGDGEPRRTVNAVRIDLAV